MNYIPFEAIPYFSECASFVEKEGYRLLELQVIPALKNTRVSLVIASGASGNENKEPSPIGISDCAKVHRFLLPHLLHLLGKNEEEVSLEVCSPGVERVLKNASEFAFFLGKEVKVKGNNTSGWILGKVKSFDERQVILETKEDGEKPVLYSDIAKAKLINE